MRGHYHIPLASIVMLGKRRVVDAGINFLEEDLPSFILIVQIS